MPPNSWTAALNASELKPTCVPHAPPDWFNGYLTTPAARETAAALPMRMTISKVNFFYGPKQILFAQFAAVAKAIAHPRRLELLEQLAQGERSVELLAERIGMSARHRKNAQ